MKNISRTKYKKSNNYDIYRRLAEMIFNRASSTPLSCATTANTLMLASLSPKSLNLTTDWEKL